MSILMATDDDVVDERELTFLNNSEAHSLND